MTVKIKLAKVRLSFPDLFTPVEYQPGDGKPRFNATFLIEPGSENDKKIDEAIKADAATVYGAKAEKTLKGLVGNTNKYCYLDGDTKDYTGYEGMKYLATHAKVRPLVIDRDKTPLTAQDGRIYAGCYVNATVEIYAQKGENTGIRAAVTGVQFHSDADAFGGGSAAKVDDFDEVEGGSDDDFT